MVFRISSGMVNLLRGRVIMGSGSTTSVLTHLSDLSNGTKAHCKYSILLFIHSFYLFVYVIVFRMKLNYLNAGEHYNVIHYMLC